MQTDFCRRLGIEYPIFAFSHCRDVVAAVSKAGGLGVFGMNAFTEPDEIRAELDWLDAHVGDKRYGIDVVIPQKHEGKSSGITDIAALEAMLEKMIPAEHKAFRDRVPRTACRYCPPTPNGWDCSGGPRRARPRHSRRR